MFLEPPCRAAHHLHVVTEGTQIVVVCHVGGGELDGHIGTAECRTVEILLVVDVYDTDNLMAAADSNLLYHPTHLAVSY